MHGRSHLLSVDILIMGILAYLAIWIGLGLTQALDNGLGQTPPMGWNPWNHFSCYINETIVKDAADTLVSTGLRDLGYNYVVIDDCWAFNETRSPTGELLPDPIRFPSGIDGVANYVHSLGMKFGLYTNAGTLACRGQPGSLHHEEIDANTFARWGVDYLKVDNCFTDQVPAPERFVAIRNALNATGRPIFYNVCNWGTENAYAWVPNVGNSWRTSWGIRDNFGSMEHNFRVNGEHPEVAGPGAWNDPDMMEIGNGGMTDLEYQTHFTLWALVKAPLMIGCNLTNMTAATLTTLSNAEIIAIDQDPLGVQGTCKVSCVRDRIAKQPEIWTAPLADGGAAVVAVNWREPVSSELNVSLGYLGLFEAYTVRDLWEHSDLGVLQDLLQVPSLPVHGVKAYRFYPVITP